MNIKQFILPLALLIASTNILAAFPTTFIIENKTDNDIHVKCEGKAVGLAPLYHQHFFGSPFHFQEAVNISPGETLKRQVNVDALEEIHPLCEFKLVSAPNSHFRTLIGLLPSSLHLKRTQHTTVHYIITGYEVKRYYTHYAGVAEVK